MAIHEQLHLEYFNDLSCLSLSIKLYFKLISVSQSIDYFYIIKYVNVKIYINDENTPYDDFMYYDSFRDIAYQLFDSKQISINNDDTITLQLLPNSYILNVRGCLSHFSSNVKVILNIVFNDINKLVLVPTTNYIFHYELLDGKPKMLNNSLIFIDLPIEII